MQGDPSAAELDQLLRRHDAKSLRRIFQAYEDDQGRQVDTARSRLDRNRQARKSRGPRRLVPLPAETPDLENFFLVEMPGIDTVEEMDAVIAELEAKNRALVARFSGAGGTA